MEVDTEYAAKVAKLNDVFRRIGFGVTLTVGVQEIEDVPGLLAAIRQFSTFTEDNDPWGEHDFGSIKWFGQKVFWKTSYTSVKFLCLCRGALSFVRLLTY